MNYNYDEAATLINKMREFGVEPDERVTAAMRELREPHYRIGFVGKFQTGKTHIINKVFLNNENLLAEGIGLCKTAVTVEIRPGNVTQFDYRNGRQWKSITNPTPDSIAEVTSATDEDEREILFHDINDAVLFYPNDLLRRVSIYDTPGIDDPNEELLRETTCKLLPELDTTVMVVAPKALSQPELRFLQKKVFAYGIGHFMMLVSCKPSDWIESKDEEFLRNQIQNQLRSIGRNNIPICFYREDESGAPVADDQSVADAIIEKAKSFTISNRIGKLRKAVAAQLSDEIARFTVVCRIHGKNQTELISMKSEAIQALNNLRQCLNDLQNEFSFRLAQYGTQCVRGFEADIRTAQEKFIDQLSE